MAGPSVEPVIGGLLVESAGGCRGQTPRTALAPPARDTAAAVLDTQPALWFGRPACCCATLTRPVVEERRLQRNADICTCPASRRGGGAADPLR